MILYFSGTGNSEYAAKRIGKATGDECLDLFDRIRGHDVSPIHAERPLVVVAPTYAWRLPRIVESWLEATPITGTKQIYFVLTCGETIGNAGQYLADLCRKKQMKSYRNKRMELRRWYAASAASSDGHRWRSTRKPSSLFRPSKTASPYS